MSRNKKTWDKYKDEIQEIAEYDKLYTIDPEFDFTQRICLKKDFWLGGLRGHYKIKGARITGRDVYLEDIVTLVTHSLIRQDGEYDKKGNNFYLTEEAAENTMKKLSLEELFPREVR